MKLPNLNDMDVSKKMLMAISGVYFVKDITEFRMAALMAGLIGVGIIAQTIIDVATIWRREQIINNQ